MRVSFLLSKKHNVYTAILHINFEVLFVHWNRWPIQFQSIQLINIARIRFRFTFSGTNFILFIFIVNYFLGPNFSVFSPVFEFSFFWSAFIRARHLLADAIQNFKCNFFAFFLLIRNGFLRNHFHGRFPIRIAKKF